MLHLKTEGTNVMTFKSIEINDLSDLDMRYEKIKSEILF